MFETPVRQPRVTSSSAPPPFFSHSALLCTQVNAKVAAKLIAQEAEAAAADPGGAAATADVAAAPGVTKRRGELVANPLADGRFAAMFEEEEYVVDEVCDCVCGGVGAGGERGG